MMSAAAPSIIELGTRPIEGYRGSDVRHLLGQAPEGLFRCNRSPGDCPLRMERRKRPVSPRERLRSGMTYLFPGRQEYFRRSP